MELYSASEEPLTGSVQVYKQSVISAIIGLLVVLGIGAAIAVAILRGDAPGFLWIIVGLLALVVLLFVGMLRAAMDPQNWVVKFDGSRLAFKFRSYLNRHFPAEDKSVAVFPASDFEWIRKVAEKKKLPGSKGRTQTESWTYLDFRLRNPESAAKLDSLIREETLREAPRIGNGRTKHHHVPMRVVDGSTLRVSWRSPRDYIRPAVDTVLMNLGAAIPVEGETKSGIKDYRQMTPEELDIFLADLAQTGHKMKAGKIAREVYGIGVKESRDYVDRLAAAPIGKD